MKKVGLLPMMVAALATSVSGCTQTARSLGPDLSVRSLYGNFQDDRAARGARVGGSDNPCFVEWRSAEETRGGAAIPALGMRTGAFLEWCRAALDSELRAANAYLVRNATGRPTAIEANAESSRYTVARYVDAGIALSNQLCKDYFERMGISEDAINFGDSLISDVGTAASGIQSVTGVGARAIGVTAALFGLGGATLRNGRDNFIFDGNIDTVYYLVIANRQTYEQAMLRERPETFWRAYSWLNSYHSSCSYMSIRVMVSDALTQRARAAATPGTPSPPVAPLHLISENLNISPDLTPTDIVAGVAMTMRTPTEVAGYRNFEDTAFTRGDETIALSALFADARNRERLISQLLVAGSGLYSSYWQQAEGVVRARAFAGDEAPAPETTPPETPPQQTPPETPPPPLVPPP